MPENETLVPRKLEKKAKNSIKLLACVIMVGEISLPFEIRAADHTETKWNPGTPDKDRIHVSPFRYERGGKAIGQKKERGFVKNA